MASEEFYFYTKGMTVGYGGVPLIRDIELKIRRGEILTLIGPNGAGKTTILRSIIRQLPLIGGAVYLDGKDISSFTGNDLAHRLSVVLTERVRPELMTCEDVVSTGRYPYTGRFGVLDKEDRKLVQESMELVHIQELKDRDFRQTSDGQKQRVMLARALCQQPEVLVLDEPTSYLDIRYKLEFLSVIQKMAKESKLTVIMSLHELDLAERISDRIACVRGDCIDRFGTPEEIFSGGYIPRLYGITAGAYNELTGSLELKKTSGTPEIFVIAGCGHGTPVFRRLQREGIPFATGILWKNDLDYPAARALAARLIAEKSFCQFSEKKLKEAKELMEGCRRVICAPGLEGELNGDMANGLRELIQYAKERNKFC